MEAHYITYSPEHKLAMNFNAASNTVVITGRPVQAIVLSHEKAEYLERDPYLAWLLRPLPMHVLLGYSAESPEAPKGPKHFCAIRWFQEAFFSASRIAQRVQLLAVKLFRVSLSPPTPLSHQSCFR